MGYIEDLVAQLYGAEAQKTIAAENPYTPFQAVPDSISQIVTGLAAKGGGNYGLGELAGTSAVSGLLSGILGGAADSYNTRTLSKYQDAITKATLGQSNTDLGLSDTLLKKADDTAASTLLRKRLQDAETESSANIQMKKAVTGKLIESALDSRSITPQQALDIADGKLDFKSLNLNNGPGKNEALLDTFKITDPNARAALANASYQQIHDYVQLSKGEKETDKSKIENTLRRELERTGSPYSMGLQISPLLLAVEDNVKTGNHTPQTDMNLVDIANKIINPGGVLRAQLVEQIKNAQNPLNKIAGDFERVLGGGMFNDTSRQQLLDVIRAVGQEKLSAAKAFADNKLAIAKNKEIDTSNLISPEYYNQLFSSLAPKPPVDYEAIRKINPGYTNQMIDYAISKGLL